MLSNSRPPIVARNEQSLKDGIDQIRHYQVIAVDTETSGLDPLKDRVWLIQLGTDSVQLVVDCMRTDPSPLREILEGPQVKVFQNAKFDLRMLAASFGLGVDNVADTMLIEQILENTFRHGVPRVSLKSMAKKYLDLELSKEERESFLEPIRDFSPAQIEYARKDVVATYRIFLKQMAELERQSLLQTAEIECRAVPAYAAMELKGICLDRARWAEAASATETEYEAARTKLLNILGGTGPGDLFGGLDADPGSDGQMKAALERLGLKKLKDLRKETLLATGNEAAALLVDFREARALRSSHGMEFLRHVHPADGRVHADFSQIAAPSGRSSCAQPNLQGIPKTERYRACLRAPEGRRIVTADYAGCELRIIAEASGDPIFIKTFNSGGDLHSIVASQVFKKNVSRTENPELRAKAKVINFGLAYGMGPAGLATQVRTSIRDAEDLLARYFRTFPTIYNFLETSAEEAIKRGYAVTLGGRKCSLPPDKGLQPSQRAEIERFAKNMPIQGTNADMIKVALAGIFDGFRSAGIDACVINMVHDEIVAEVPEKSAGDAALIVKRQMEKAGRRFIRKVPVEVECHIGEYWGDAGEKV
jgi:DNA polymerase I-like protein with 3'-5' exonuclease and polymerase domains